MATHPRRSRESLAEAQAEAIGRSHFQGFSQSWCRGGRRWVSPGSSRALLPPRAPAPWDPLPSTASSSAGQFLQPFSPAPLRPSGAKLRGCSWAQDSQGHLCCHLHRGHLGRARVHRACRRLGVQERLRSEADCGDSCATETPWDLREGSCQCCTAPLYPLFTQSKPETLPHRGTGRVVDYNPKI